MTEDIDKGVSEFKIRLDELLDIKKKKENLAGKKVQAEEVVRTHQEEVERLRKQEDAITADEQLKEIALLEAAGNSGANMFMYHAYQLNPHNPEKSYNEMMEKYAIFSKFIQPNRWMVMEDSGTVIVSSGAGKKKVEHQLPYDLLLIGRANEKDPVRVVKSKESDELGLEVRVCFSKEGYILRAHGINGEGLGSMVSIETDIKERKDYGVNSQGIPYWEFPPELLTSFAKEGNILTYIPTEIDEFRRINFHSEERLKMMDIDYEGKTLQEVYESVKRK